MEVDNWIEPCIMAVPRQATSQGHRIFGDPAEPGLDSERFQQSRVGDRHQRLQGAPES